MIAVAAVLALLMFFAFSDGNSDFLKALFTKFSNEDLRDRLEDVGWRGYVITTVLAMLQVLCTFLPAEPIQMLAGFTFGFPVGLLCCMAGVLVGNTLIFMLQKTFGDRMRSFFVKKLNLDMEKIARSGKSALIIFILYFLPAIPYGMICFLAAGLGMSYRRYLFVTVLGALPSVCIGVGLGHVAVSLSWPLALGLLALFIVFALLLLRKKDVFFTKINDYAEKHKFVNKNKVRDVNGPLLSLVYYLARFYCFLCGIRIQTTNNVGVPEKPSVILCNHGSFIDFVYAEALLRKFKPNFVVARLYFYNTKLAPLLRTLGAFPKSMFATDVESVKNCLTVLREKNHLTMMPEARLSTVGRFEDIQESTYSFLQKCGVSIYSLKISGDYFADPKWGRGFRRGALVEARLDRLYSAEEVKTISLEELKEGIENRLFYDEFQWLETHPEVHYRSPRMAEGLENVLNLCPLCHGKHTLTTKKNKIFCSHCGELTSLDDRYRFTGNFQFETFGQWYDWQKEVLEREIFEDEDYALSSSVELRLPGTGKGLTRHGGVGTCTLNREGLTYCGTKDGKEVELHFPLRQIYRLLFGAGENFEIYNGSEILYFVPEEKRSAVDWYLASMILYDRAQSYAWKGESLS